MTGFALPSIPIVGTTSPCLANGCTACCHDIEMLLTNEDLSRLQRARPGEKFWFQADDGYLQLRTRDGPAVMEGAGRPCHFLGGDGRCTVWSDRPEGCRLYPAVWDDDIVRAHLDDDWCPHTDGFQLDDATTKAARALAERLHAQRARRL